jgi:hypothetical protein
LASEETYALLESDRLSRGLVPVRWAPPCARPSPSCSGQLHIDPKLAAAPLVVATTDNLTWLTDLSRVTALVRGGP